MANEFDVFTITTSSVERRLRHYLTYLAAPRHGNSDMNLDVWLNDSILFSDTTANRQAHVATVLANIQMQWCNRHDKKAQLSLTNPRDACKKFAWFT